MTIKMQFSDEVATACRQNTPIVALESTIITHGMPYPQNVKTAREVEQCVRKFGATPATIAVLDGQLHIGLTDDQLEKLAKTKDVAKLSRTDFAVCLATAGTGATTVAATMIAAHLAGIKVFATGGIGGVHRGAELDFDISADLQELAKTPVTVVAAGPKAILDVPKTLEVLETLGVPVIAFKQNDIPAFWSRHSGLPSPLRMDTAEDIAKAQVLRTDLGLSGGQLINNPIPQDDEISQQILAPIIAKALLEAKEKQISAKAVTPFLLQRIFELTEGDSLIANIALVKNNAQLAAQIACAFHKIS